MPRDSADFSQPHVGYSKMSFLKRSLARLVISRHKSNSFTIGSPLMFEGVVEGIVEQRDEAALHQTLRNGCATFAADADASFISSPVTPPGIVEVPGLEMSPDCVSNLRPSALEDPPRLESPATRKSLYGEIFTRELPLSILDSDDETSEDNDPSFSQSDVGTLTTKDAGDRVSLTTCISERDSRTSKDLQRQMNFQDSANIQEKKGPCTSSSSSDAMAVTAGYVNPIAIRSPRPKCDPIEKAKRDIAALEGAEAEFTVAMDFIFSKLVISMSDPDSAYLFRDFAGHVTSFLDRFGPGGYDSHRAPRQISWMLKIILPWTYIEDSASEYRVAIYSEVNGWIQNITHFLGVRSAATLMEEGVWDSSVEHMASSNPVIAESAYRTAKTIVSSLPFDYELVCKVLLIRNITIGYDEENMITLRTNYVRLLNRVVERIKNTKSRKNAHEFSMNLSEIIRELKRSLAIESDIRLYNSTRQCLAYATSVYDSLDTLIMDTPAAHAREIVSSTNLRDGQFSSALDRLEKPCSMVNEISNCVMETDHANSVKTTKWSKFVRGVRASKSYSSKLDKAEGRQSDHKWSDARSVVTNASTRSRVSQHIRRLFHRPPHSVCAVYTD